MSTRIKSLISILLVSSAIFMVSTQSASAATAFEIMVTESLNTIETIVLGLSDDIGLMADNILVMADNIGIMADRIVNTEQMMADVVTNGVTCK